MTLYPEGYGPEQSITIPCHGASTPKEGEGGFKNAFCTEWITKTLDNPWRYLVDSFVNGSIVWVANKNGRIVCGTVRTMAKRETDQKLYVEMDTLDGYYGGRHFVDEIVAAGIIMFQEDYEKIMQGESTDDSSAG